jgi:hypothetical protein
MAQTDVRHHSFTLDQLIGDKRAALEQHLEAVAATSQA